MDWLSAIRRYLVAVAAGNLVWEFAQMPLYTLGRTGTRREIILAGLHCTAGDVLIAAAALLAALALFGTAGWPKLRWLPVAVAVIMFGAGYTLFSEYFNTVVRRSWAYSSLMPTLPWLGTGLAPLVQWLLIPPVALVWAAGKLPRGDHKPRHCRRLLPVLLVTKCVPALASMAQAFDGTPVPDLEPQLLSDGVCNNLPQSSPEIYDLHAAPLERVVVLELGFVLDRYETGSTTGASVSG